MQNSKYISFIFIFFFNEFHGMICNKLKNCFCFVPKYKYFGTQLSRQSKFLPKQNLIDKLINKVQRPGLQISVTRHLSDMAASMQKRSNRLALEKSPYLLQHANNPVDWYPWGDEAFSKALKENKLIFLSIGYSTCHWCHVMEKESFENEEIAKIMNENFVCVKVDREERPDVDRLYMLFVQAYSGQGGWPMSVWLRPDLIPVAGGTYYPPEDQFGKPGGGWPLSVWLTPKLQPVFGGTYFPPDESYGRPGFKSILTIIASQWHDGRQKFSESGRKIIEFLEEQSSLDSTVLNPESQSLPDISCQEKCFYQLSKNFDSRFGGFSDAPKFPHLVNLNFLFHYYSRNPESESGKNALDMCTLTLKMMAKGGIHDHIGQGFARYSVDHKWHVPHFEKMLYDQAQLAVSYTSAYLATKDQFFAEIVEDILLYVNRDLSHPAGGFYSAEDADSLPKHDANEKKEGAFYVWTEEEIKQLLSQTVSERPDLTYSNVFCKYYNVYVDGNVSSLQDPHSELKNQNVLLETESEEEVATKLGLPSILVKKILKESREILFEHRKKRPRPHLDDKIITSWNGLMISGFAKAGQALNNFSHVQRAIGAAKFIHQFLYNNNTKTLLRSCYKAADNTITQTANPINGFLDDYAFLIRGLLDLYEASFDSSWIEWAESLQETQDRLFWDEGNAGYFASPSGDSSIIVRMKEDHDGAEPSGNSVAVHNLLRLWAYLDRNDFRERAKHLLAAFTSRLSKTPVIVPEMVSGLLFYHDGPTQVFITGTLDSPDSAALLNIAQSRLIPNRVLALIEEDKENILYKKNDIIRSIKSTHGKATAYVCHHHTCSLPVTTREELSKLLDEQK